MPQSLWIRRGFRSRRPQKGGATHPSLRFFRKRDVETLLAAGSAADRARKARLDRGPVSADAVCLRQPRYLAETSVDHNRPPAKKLVRREGIYRTPEPLRNAATQESADLDGEGGLTSGRQRFRIKGDQLF